ncbi:hypothetical protein QFZ47_005697 [Variovorax paradoxus]|nr:hypothetical protein [Variovorax paradoxus]
MLTLSRASGGASAAPPAGVGARPTGAAGAARTLAEAD